MVVVRPGVAWGDTKHSAVGAGGGRNSSHRQQAGAAAFSLFQVVVFLGGSGDCSGQICIMGVSW